MKITIWVDRSRANLDDLTDEIQSLGRTVQGLQVEWGGVATSSVLLGRIRTFVPFVALSHESDYALEVVCEELLAQFGWCVDVRQ